MKLRVVMNGTSSFTCKTSLIGAAVLCATLQKVSEVSSFHACYDDMNNNRSDWYCIWYREKGTTNVVFTPLLPSFLTHLTDRNLWTRFV